MKNIGTAFVIGVIYDCGAIALIAKGEHPYLVLLTMFLSCLLLVGIVISIENYRERKSRGRTSRQ
ncbi:MAG: hypothetical protein KBC15_02935 [Candidatus Levybacteria bacterium]|nr:hypothetical protein [Candidatus Levybacteria bacterium]